VRAASTFTDGIVPCDWTGTGCLLIHRSVFLSIMEKLPDNKALTNEGTVHDFFRPLEKYPGEDQTFCYYARECGIQPFVDTRLHAIHVGYKAYGGHTSLPI
jgi:hypothetical protein